jgi:subtilisin family serine protease
VLSFSLLAVCALLLYAVTPGATAPQTLLAPEQVLAGGAAAEAAANNFRQLQPWEFAVANTRAPGKDDGPSDAKDDGATTTLVQLADGQRYSLPQTQGGATTIMTGQPGVASYVREDERLSVAGANAPDPAEKIDPRLRRAGAGETPVIIRLNLPFRHFYDAAGRNAATRSFRRQEFAKARDRVAALLHGRGRVKHDLPIIGGVAATLNAAALDQLAKDDAVARVEPDVVARITLDTSVDEIHARETWQLSDGNNNPLTGVGKRIAIIDTGVDYLHPDLGGCLGAGCKVIGGWNFLTNTADPLDDNGHGTHVAATAAGNGLLKGVAPDAKILAYKVCNSGGSCSGSDIIRAIDYATDPDRDGDLTDHVDVASMSLGGGGNPDDAMSIAVDNASYAGVVCTVAAGNSGPGIGTINSPGTSRSALTVAAACKSSQIGVDSRCAGPIASFSSRGPLVWDGSDLHKPDVAAPGVLICAARFASAFAGSPTCFDTQHIRISGTSMATPHVAGAAALVRQAYPGYDPEQVKLLLKTSARNLGVSANDQGAGEIDLRAAIPSSTKVSVTPGLWEVYTDPSVQTTQADMAFNVTPIDPNIQTLTVSANMPVPGVSLSFDRTTLNVAGQTSDFLIATMLVDNDVAHNGDYSGSIVLSENGQSKGIIPVIVHVAATVRITPAPVVDYGVDNPTLANWTASQTVTVTNFRTDVSQTLSIAPPTFPAGVTYQVPTSVTVPPDSAVQLNTSISVNNAVTANGTYGGSLRFANSTVDVGVTAKFVKFFVLTINDPNGSDIVGATAYLHNRSTMQSLFNVNVNPAVLYLDSAGPYDLMLYYNPRVDAEGAHDYVVFRESISLASGAATVTASRDDAAYQTRVVGTDPGGTPTGALGRRYATDTYVPAHLGLARFTFYTDWTINYFSAVSANYTHGEIFTGQAVQAAPVLDFYYGGFTGISGNLTFANTAADFHSVQLNTDLNRDTGAALPLVWSCTQNSTTCFASYNRNNTLAPPVSETVYTLLPAGAYHYQESDSLRTGCPASGPCSSIFVTPYLDVATHARKANILDAGGFPAWQGNAVYNGLGPSVWTAKFANTSGLVKLLPYYGSTNAAFMRQDFAYQDYAAVPYTLTRTGSTTFGSLPAMSAGSIPAALPTIGTAAGQYQFNIASFSYRNRGVSLNAQVSATFDTALADPNPPALTQLQYTTNGARSDIHDSAANNQLFFSMDAVGGSLSQVSAGYSGDGVTFTPLTVTPAGGGYTATVPAVGFTKIALRLTGVDSSNNRLDYTFELPAVNPLADGQVPTTSITAPAAGATVAGVVNVQASASDNVGVTQVEFYQDGALLGADTTAPYSFSWNTRATSNGSHTLTSKAYDAAGNAGTSAPVAVTVNNDLTPPATSITSPTNGQVVTGVVAVQVSASDNVGVTSVELYQDGALIGTDASAPYAFNWNTDATTEGGHTLTSKAYDAAGNAATSAPVSVTVNYDPTPPTVALTAPADGASLTGTVTVSADAADNKAVARVEFYRGATLLGTDTAAPYSFSWNTSAEPPGAYTLTAKAFDTHNNSATSAPRNVTVRDAVAPTTQITSPANNANVTRRTTVTIAANAADNIGVSRVEFYVGGALTCTDTAAPYTCAWSVPNSANKPYQLQTRAFDAAGNVGTSAVVTVTAR